MLTKAFCAVALMAAALACAPAAAQAQEVVGDPVAGKAVYGRFCRMCHQLGRSASGGPDIKGVVGRTVAADPDFGYSPALKAAGAAKQIWDTASLDKFLQNPTVFLPGTAMPFAVANAQQRADIVAYLKVGDEGAAPAAAQ